ncbi:MAG: hypothetical protein RIR51_868 [Bacteroidota bacterium]
MQSEKLGITLSILCAIHCLSLPLILFFAPYIASSFVFNESFEWFLVIISFLLAAFLLIKDYRRHKNLIPIILLSLAFLTKLIDFIVNQESYHWFYGICLGVFISLAYWKNYQHKTTCSCKIS